VPPVIRRRIVLAPLVALSLVAVACSGDDGGGGSSTVDPDRTPQQQLADEFIDQIDDEAAMELIDTDCIYDLMAMIPDDDAIEIVAMIDAGMESVPDDVDPELRGLLDEISFRLFDCVIFDEGDGEFEVDPDFDGEIEIIELDPDGEGALEG